MTSLPKIATVCVSYSNGCPVSQKQIIIKMLVPDPLAYAFGITDKDGFTHIPVLKDQGRVIVEGTTVYYGPLTSGRIDIELREICPELPD